MKNPFKNPLRNLSPRGRRIYYTILVVVVFAICLTNCLSILVFNATSNDQCAWRAIKNSRLLLITDIVPGGVADKAGINNGDTLLALNGRSLLDSTMAPQPTINAIPSGEYATYFVGGKAGRYETKVQILKVFNIIYLANFLLGLGFLIVGYIVVLTRPQGQVQRMFANYSIGAMLFFGLVFPDTTPNDFWLKNFTLFWGSGLAHIIAPPLFVRFFFYFPVQRKNLQKKWIVWSLYISSVLFLATGVFLQKYSQVVGAIGFLGPYLYYVAGLLVFAHSYFKYVDKEKRKQLRPILLSAIVGIAAFIYIVVLGTTNVFLIFLNPAMFIPGILIINVPIAFGYSIFRYRLMDIDLIIKRSLIYGTVTASLAAMYLVIVFGIGNSLAYFFGTEENRVLNVLAFIIIALAFDPIKRRTQELIDRSFYAERYNYQKALLEFSQELPRLMNLDQILQSMVNRISNTMHIEKVAVIVCDEMEGCSAATKSIPTELSQFTNTSSLIQLLRQTKAPLTLVLLEDEPESIPLNEQDKHKIITSKIVLSVPMFIQERLIGTINVGVKMSGKIYSQEDVDLLSTVASQAAIAIENARLHVSELEKQKIEEQLEIARRIQQSLLPKKSPAMERLDIAGISIPALSVGGDYFDYIQLGQKKLLVVVADVSGKGMSAALYMSKIQGMIQLASHMYDSPRDMLIHVNRRLYDGIERKSFITMVLALFDLEKNTVQICRAGHNRAIIGTNGSFEYLHSTGIGLGLERGPIFEQSLEEATRPLQSDSIFFFYSDGLSEAMNERQEQFGEETICTFVESNKKLPASELQEQLMRSINEYQGAAEQHDDITWVIVKYN
ncbi:MAG: GAF domain-containing protein [Bacteroidetes bacterium]|nr:MAG: GAF domain-containing protein [Bacteroidota bacterium]